MPEPTLNRMVWIDTETGGLSAQKCPLLEVAIIVTDGQLNELGSYETLIQTDKNTLESLDPFVLNMHKTSGLYDRLLLNETHTLKEAEENLCQLLLDTDAKGAILAGNNVSFDRNYLAEYLPTFEKEYLHYRNIDVSTLKEIFRMNKPEVLEKAPSKKLVHLAMDDIKESIEEYKHYLPYLL